MAPTKTYGRSNISIVKPSDAYNSLFLKTTMFKKTNKRKLKKRLPLRELPIRNVRNDNSVTALTSNNSINVSMDNTFDKLLKQEKPFTAFKKTNKTPCKKKNYEESSSSGWSCLQQKGDTQISFPILDDTSWDSQPKQKRKPFEISFSFFTRMPKNVENLFNKDESSLGCDKFTQNLHRNVKKFCSTPVLLNKNNEKNKNKFCSTPVQVNTKSNNQEFSEKSLLEISSVVPNKKNTEVTSVCFNINRSSLKSFKKSLQYDTGSGHVSSFNKNDSSNATSAVEEGPYRNKDLEIAVYTPKISDKKSNNQCLMSPDLFSDDQGEEFYGFSKNQLHYSSFKQEHILAILTNELSNLSNMADEEIFAVTEKTCDTFDKLHQELSCSDEQFGNTSKIHKFECIKDLRENSTKKPLRCFKRSSIVEVPSNASSSAYTSGEVSYNPSENQSEKSLNTFDQEQDNNFGNISSVIKSEPIKELRVNITKFSLRNPSQLEDDSSNTSSSHSVCENGLYNQSQELSQDQFDQSQKSSIHKNFKDLKVNLTKHPCCVNKPSTCDEFVVNRDLVVNLTRLLDSEKKSVSQKNISKENITKRRKRILSYEQPNITDYCLKSSQEIILVKSNLDLFDYQDNISRSLCSDTANLQKENLSVGQEEVSNNLSETCSPIIYRKRTRTNVLQSSTEESTEYAHSLLSLSSNISDQTNVLEHVDVASEENEQNHEEQKIEVGGMLVENDGPESKVTVGKNDDKVSLSKEKSFNLDEIMSDKSVIFIHESPIKLKPGKGWRRSLCMFKNKCGVKLSEEPKLTIGRPSFLPCLDGSDIQDVSLSENLKRLSVVSESIASDTPRDIVLRRCNQKSPMKFSKCFSNSVLKNCQKIGEGVYGEVFLLRNPKGGLTVLKIIPIEGDMMVNGERQKKFEEVMSEIVIASELSNLRISEQTDENFFTKIQKIKCIQGKYPQKLIDLWEEFEETKGTENDSPTLFKNDQLYIAFQMSFGGKDLEAYEFRNAKQAFSAICQVAVGIALAEKQLKFEHRDLHWGNVLIADEPDKKKVFSFEIDDKHYGIPLEGIRVSIIDFTLSRIDCKGVTIYNDLSADPDLFAAHGDYQFDVYRLMQKANRNNWTTFEPYTNVLWMHYLLDKSIKGFRYKYAKSNVHKSYIEKLKSLFKVVLKCKNLEEFLCEYVL